MKNSVIRFLAVIYLGFSVGTVAARSASLNTIYCDLRNNVVGQNVYTCNNIHWRGDSQSGQYQLMVRGGDGNILTTCSDGSAAVVCRYSNDYSISSSLGGSHPGATLQDACTISGACGFDDLVLMDNWGFAVQRVN
ncbi:hypothetical protein [Xanthomonas arboricola]|uniref:hypothetical protein n=1 Tax=Xanthomonas arboricola TaxID=56448 RepID=UPI0012901C8B|nr:hypothetical protein [Xanthomonas arboricola]